LQLVAATTHGACGAKCTNGFFIKVKGALAPFIVFAGVHCCIATTSPLDHPYTLFL